MPRTVVVVALAVAALVVVALVVLTALGVFAGTNGAGAPSSTGRAGAERSGAAATSYYVSLGDSYAVGYQPAPFPGPTAGFTGVVARDTGLKLANFGCGGATTTSILHAVGCTPPYGPQAEAGAVAYPTRTQAAAAVAFLHAHRGHVGLVTVSIGGNDVTRCADASDPTQCVLGVVGTVRSNVLALAEELRAAAGPRVPIVGLTYPDVLLGLWVYPPGHPDRSLASLSVAAFQDFVNPALAGAYGLAGATFLDVTEETGGYVPLSRTTTLRPYGTVPVAVAEVCRLTWYCTLGNVHATSAGYRQIGHEIVRVYRSSS